MPAPSVSAITPKLRAIVRSALVYTPLSQVAREIGMTGPGLRHFVEQEGTPRPATLRKIELWAMKRGGGASDDLQELAFLLLVEALPERERREGARTLLEALRIRYEHDGAAVPKWIKARLKKRSLFDL